MSRNTERHLVVVRHGESEGDVRRAARTNEARHASNAHPEGEEQTPRGEAQSAAAGRWVTRYVLERYNFKTFDVYASSPLIRVKQSAQSLELASNWQTDPLLKDRDRGKIKGLSKRQHQELYPGSYEQMTRQPFLWRPPGGETMLEVTGRAQEFTRKTARLTTILAVTHRDWMWAAHIPLDGLDVEKVQLLNTDKIGNAQVFHYTNVNPADGSVESPEFCWKRSVCPWADEKSVQTASERWTEIVPEKLSL